MTQLLIVGQGLAGLFAASMAAEKGAQVTLVAHGRGGLGLSHGCIEVWGQSSPASMVRSLPASHPYTLTGLGNLHSAIEAFAGLVRKELLSYVGNLTRNLQLPTPLGCARYAALAPSSQAKGDLSDQGPALCIIGLQGFRDFHAGLLTSNLRRLGAPVDEVLVLPLIGAPSGRDAYAPDLARLFDQPPWRREVARGWKPRLTKSKRIGLPAVLGMENHGEVVADLENHLGVPIFEIPTLPPSVPGLRLERALRHACLRAGVNVVEGARVTGVVDGRSGGRLVSGVVAQTAGGPREITADAVLLASGGILHGGLIAMQDGRILESVFDLPVMHDDARGQWTAQTPWEPQPYATFGVSVNETMQPIGKDGRPLFDNLFAAGGLLAGADRTLEGSRQGIDLATAFAAVGVILG